MTILCFILVALCVVGNKTDLSGQREVSRERGEEFAHQIGAMYTETSAAENTGERSTRPCQSNCESFILLAGVKEAFLKVAQGVISLFQHNQLKASSVDPSFSLMNSSIVATNQLQSNGHNPPVAVDSAKPTIEDNGILHRCCGT